MEQIPIDIWVKRRVGAAVGGIAQTAANMLPLPVAVGTGGGFSVKATLAGIAITMPPKPRFQELEGINPNVGVMVDIFEAALLGQTVAGQSDRIWVTDIKHLQPTGPNGTPMLASAFFGQDP